MTSSIHIEQFVMSQTNRPGFNGFMSKMSEACGALTTFGNTALKSGLEAEFLELLELRASQLNGCAFCIQYHLSLARDAGLSQHKIDVVVAWREASIFSPAEKAALAWTEHLTRLNEQGAPDDAWRELQKHFSDEQIVSITVAISSINAWNRIALGLGFQTPAA
jgi:AhpD family alkylhydroperoxidase